MEERECYNCVHYIRHYIKRNDYFWATHCGSCKKRKANGRLRKTDMACEEYIERDKEEEREQAVKTVTESLSKIASRLTELREVLATSSDNNRRQEEING